MDEQYGRLEIRLSELMNERGLNRNKLALKAEMNWYQINKYYNNTITRLDTFVLCKLCTVLDCKIQDLLTFIPAETDDK
ncbi:MAG: helix-turn-helix transcriptional regulator [Eubacterium sp.]|nr:helix-turn-helix transcriptional regulator [Eubacterium sp.]